MIRFLDIFNNIANTRGSYKSYYYEGFLFVYFGINEFSLFRSSKGKNHWIGDYDFEDFDYYSSVDNFLKNIVI